MRKRDVPNKVKVKVIPDQFFIEGIEVEKLVNFILKDYCQNFGLKVKYNAPLSLVLAPSFAFELDPNATERVVIGGTMETYERDGIAECAIFMNSDVLENATDGEWDPLSLFCHEIIHYCQFVTGRFEGYDETEVPYNYRLTEIEAYGLQEYFATEWLKRIKQNTN